MQFILKRLFYHMRSKPVWLLVIAVPLFLYLLYCTFVPYSYTVQKSLKISQNSPIALPNHPTKYLPLEQALESKSGEIFFSNYPLSKLLKRLMINTDLNIPEPKLTNLHKLVKKNTKFDLSAKDELTVKSFGKNLEIQKVITGFYLEFVLNLSNQGLKRQKKGQPSQAESSPISALESGKTLIQGHKSLFAPDRLFGLFLVLIIFLPIYILIILVLEINDNTFKSERQVVQYLDLELIGSIPNLNKIAQAFSHTSKK